jgi:hypothetical protein
LKGQALKRERQMQGLESRLGRVGQERTLQESMRDLQAREAENLLRSKVGAVQNRLNLERMLSGEKMIYNPPVIGPEVRRPGALDRTTEALVRDVSLPALKEMGEGLYRSSL